jgi:DNA polymerase-3 subunit alpha
MPASESLKKLGKICIANLQGLRDTGKLFAPYPDYWNRLMYELRVIGDLGYEDIFLITMQAIQHARSKGVVVGPARGSAAGSLVCHTCGITHGVDPIRFGLRFERFLNPDRVTSADIDVDFSDREVPIQFLIDTYGENRVIYVGTKGLFKIKSALDEFARVFDVNFVDAKRVNKCFDDKGEVVKEEEHARWRAAYPDWFATAEFFADSKRFRNASRHPSAVIVADGPVGREIPLQSVTDSKTKKRVLTTEWDGDELEAIGFTKFDFLRISVLDVIRDTILMVNNRSPGTLPSPDTIFDDPDYTDRKTLELLDAADLNGVFQVWKGEPVGLFRKMNVRGFEDVYHVTTVIRPGIDRKEYLDAHANPNGVVYPAPILKEILGETYGLIMYQEQIMDLCHKMAGFTLAQADTIRKIISKTSNLGDTLSLEPYRVQFIEGCVTNGYDRALAETLWAEILKRQKYGFNKSHAVAYSLISWITAYLKAHHPHEFLVACLNDKNEGRFTDDLVKRGFTILPPDVQSSKVDHVVVQGGMRFGLRHIKGVGQGSKIIEQMQPFADRADFTQRCRLSSDVMDVLEAVGALDSLPDRDVLGNLVAKRQSAAGRLAAERENLGYYVTGNPLDPFKDQLAGSCVNKNVAAKTIKLGGIVTRLKPHTTGKQKLMAFVTIQTAGDDIEVIIWPEDWDRVKDVLRPDTVLIGEGRRTERGGYALGRITILSQ